MEKPLTEWVQERYKDVRREEKRRDDNRRKDVLGQGRPKITGRAATLGCCNLPASRPAARACLHQRSLLGARYPKKEGYDDD